MLFLFFFQISSFFLLRVYSLTPIMRACYNIIFMLMLPIMQSCLESNNNWNAYQPDRRGRLVPLYNHLHLIIYYQLVRNS